MGPSEETVTEKELTVKKSFRVVGVEQYRPLEIVLILLPTKEEQPLERTNPMGDMIGNLKRMRKEMEEKGVEKDRLVLFDSLIPIFEGLGTMPQAEPFRPLDPIRLTLTEEEYHQIGAPQVSQKVTLTLGFTTNFLEARQFEVRDRP